jgi:hypothetical protein
MDPCFLVVVVVDCNDNKNFLLEVNPSKNLRILRKEEQDEEQEQETLPQTSPFAILLKSKRQTFSPFAIIQRSNCIKLLHLQFF